MQGASQGLVSATMFLVATVHGLVAPPQQAAHSSSSAVMSGGTAHTTNPADAAGTRVDAARGAANPASTAVPRVEVFGDSVTWESEIFIAYALNHRAQVNFHVFGGTSMCMWFDQMRQVAATKPSMVLVTFAAWQDRPCDHTTDIFREVQDDAGTTATIFKGIPVVFASDPTASTFTAAQQKQLNNAYRAAVATHRNAKFNNPASTVLANGSFTTYLPCLRDETASMGCQPVYGGVIKVRAPDGVHLCPIVPPEPGHCPMYSSGERRFGTALAAPAVAALPVMSTADTATASLRAY